MKSTSICFEFPSNRSSFSFMFLCAIDCMDSNSSWESRLTKSLENLNRSRTRSEAEHKKFLAVLGKYKAAHAIKRTPSAAVISEEIVAPQDAGHSDAASSQSDAVGLGPRRTSLSAVQLALNLATEKFSEKELIEGIVSPQKTSRPALDREKVLDIKNQIPTQFPDAWLECRYAMNQKGRDLKRKKKEETISKSKEKKHKKVGESEDAA